MKNNKAQVKNLKLKGKAAVENPAYKSVSELKQTAAGLRKEITMNRLKVRSGKERNTRKGFNTRKELAKILTALNSKRTDNQPQSEV